MSGCGDDEASTGCCNTASGGDCGDATPAPAEKQQFEYLMVGVKVLFPVKPYPSQMAIMAQVRVGWGRSY